MWGTHQKKGGCEAASPLSFSRKLRNRWPVVVARPLACPSGPGSEAVCVLVRVRVCVPACAPCPDLYRETPSRRRVRARVCAAAVAALPSRRERRRSPSRMACRQNRGRSPPLPRRSLRLRAGRHARLRAPSPPPPASADDAAVVVVVAAALVADDATAAAATAVIVVWRRGPLYQKMCKKEKLREKIET